MKKRVIDVKRFLEDAKSFEGVRYHHQGRSEFGLDCIGLAVAALSRQGIAYDSRSDYAPTPHGQSLVKGIEASGMLDRIDHRTEDLEPGDILVFTMKDDPQHVGIALEDPRYMIHAAAITKFVRIVPLTALWLTKLTHVYRWR